MELRNRFKYDTNSPTGIVWAEDRYSGKGYLIKSASKDSPAGSIGKRGYYLVDFEGKKRFVHHIVWELCNGDIPNGMVIDHLDGNKLNNRIENLRVVDHTINNRNSGRISKSGVVGVRFVQITNRQGMVFDYWKASWVDLEGKPMYVNFSVLKFGYDEARNKAIEKRKDMVEYLNQNGAGYTERHLLSNITS